MSIKDIVGIILLVIAVIGLWIYSIYEYRTNRAVFLASKFEYFSLPIFMTVLSGLVIFLSVFMHFFKPPEKIEKNGYTYYLEDYEPEQTIEQYGRTYVLVTE